MSLDTNILFFLNGLTGTSNLFDGTIVFLASYLPWLLVAAFVLWLYFSAYPKNEKIFIFLVAAISALISRFGIAELIRFFYQRPRPFLTYQQVHPLFTDTDPSFPSGHATFFFAIAMAVFLYNKKWGTVLLIGTLLVTISRIAVGMHYPSDILGGIIIGIAVAYVVSFIAERWRAKIKL